MPSPTRSWTWAPWISARVPEQGTGPAAGARSVAELTGPSAGTPDVAVAFLADNPGIWMDHCHDLDHANDGLVAHPAYAGVIEPFRVGGLWANAPE